MAITFRGAGAGVTSAGGVTGNLKPAIPTGLQVNDLMLCFCSAAKDTQVFSAVGWTPLWHLSQSPSMVNTIALLYRFYQDLDLNPTVTWTGGGVNCTTIMQICAFRGVSLSNPFDVRGATSLNSSQQNIGPIGGITTGASGKCIIVFGHRADDWTSVATLTGNGFGWNEIGEPDSASGNDAGEVWDYTISAYGAVQILAKTFVVTGGTANYGLGVMQSLNEEGIVTGWRKLQYLTEPPTIGAFNKLKFAVEPPVSGAFNKLLYDGE